MKCILTGCNNEIPSDRMLRKQSVTCCNEHGNIHSINRMTRRRAKGRPVLDCSVGFCHKVFIDFGKGDTKCSKCRGSKMGRQDLGRRDNYNYDPIGRGVGGKMHSDHREKICVKDGKLCDGYSACMFPQPVEGKSSWQIIMEYEANGGINCFHLEDTPNRVSYGDSFGTCSENHVR